MPPNDVPAKPTQARGVPRTNVAAIVSVVAAVVSVLVLPVVFGPIALIAGVHGDYYSRKEGLALQKLALVGLLVGLCTSTWAVWQLSH